MSRTPLIASSLALAALVALAGTARAAGPDSYPPTPLLAKIQIATQVAPAPTTPGPTTLVSTSLTRIYRGQDGGALYLRQLGTKVYGFGEHPGRGYAYVLQGLLSGDRLTGSWWDVPKGSRGQAGSLDLRVSQQGTKLTRAGGGDLGPDTFTGIGAQGIRWPVRQAAGFQSTTQTDLDGAFDGGDGSRHYLRQTGSTVAWVAERGAQPDERPGWVSVFVGTRNAGSGLSGTWVDVPKGLQLRSGPFGAALVGTTRELVLAQPGTDRSTRLVPEYTLDWNRFEREIVDRLEPNAVGGAYAILRHGAFLRTGAFGHRRLGIDGGSSRCGPNDCNVDFTTKTQAQTASAAKLVSATAIVKALRDRGLTVDAKVKPFLPSCIDTASSIGTLRFRDILDHTSGLPGARGTATKGSCNGENPYECLLEILKAGRTQTQQPAYNNKAYDLLRLLVPLVADREWALFKFDLHECKNTGGVLHRQVSGRFAGYVLQQVLGPAGARASWSPTGDFSLNYKCEAKGARPCVPTAKGEAPRADFIERSGSGKMTISVLDYGRFLSALDRGLIVPKSLVETMKTDRLGFDTAFGGRAGPYAWKNGGCPDFGNKGRTCKTVAMTFPGDIQAYVAVNSDIVGGQPSIQTIVGRAFDAALR